MKRRITYLDLIKLIALIFVCVSHVYQRTVPNAINTKFFEFLYSLHMALFMLVGGILVKKTTSFKELGKYILKLMLSYLFPAVLFTLITVLIVPNYKNHDILYWFKEYVVRTDTFYWYFISAFIINTLLAFSYTASNKIFKKPYFSFPLMALFNALFIFILVILYKQLGRDVLAFDLTLFYYFIGAVGFITYYIHELVEKTNKALFIRLIVLGITLASYITGFIILRSWVKMTNFLIDDYHFIWYLVTSTAGAIATYIISMLLVRIKVIDRASVYGKYSKEFYLLHVLFLRIITPYVAKISGFTLYSVVFIICYSLVILTSTLSISVLLNKNKYISLALFGNLSSFKKPQPNNE